MVQCNCEHTTRYRATNESAGEDYLYLRCGECGGKVGRVPIDLAALAEALPDALQTDAVGQGPDVPPAAVIEFDMGDNPLNYWTDE